jgi:hypothetical protein
MPATLKPDKVGLRESLRVFLTFRIKMNVATGHESFGAWRERDHDDLVLAVALACWLGEKLGGPLQVLPADPKATSVVANLPADALALRPDAIS